MNIRILRESRLLGRNKVTTLILISGIAIGFLSTFFIYLYISHELAYDRQHPDAERLYRVYTANYDQHANTYTYKDAMSFNLSGPTLLKEFPEVVEYTRIYDLPQGLNVRIGDQLFHEKKSVFADPAVLKLFHISWIAGNRTTALSNPRCIVLTRSIAEKYFGQGEPVGQLIEVTNTRLSGVYQVTGVIEDAVNPSHISFDLLLSYSTLWQHNFEPNWNNFDHYTYVQLEKGTNIRQLNSKLMPLSRKYLGENTTLVFQLQPVTAIHLYSDMAYEAETNGDINKVIFLSITMLLILVIASINCLNLLMAKAIPRAGEVGLRKALGADRRALFVKYFGETLILHVFALSVALIVLYALLPAFNELTGLRVDASLQNTRFYVVVTISFVFSSIISGIYPAAVQSSFTSLHLVKGHSGRTAPGFGFQKVLILAQFTASAFLLSVTLIIHDQIQLMQNHDVGMDLEQIVVLPAPESGVEGDLARQSTFADMLRAWPEIGHVSLSSSVPSGDASNISSISGGIWWDKKITESRFTFYAAQVDDHFFPAYGISFLAGRNFSRALSSDTMNTVIINQAAGHLLGFEQPDNAVDEFLIIPTADGPVKHRVIGVISDFARRSLKFETEPTIYFYREGVASGFFSIKFLAGNFDNHFADLESAWYQLFPSSPFLYFFADDAFDQLYRSEVQFGKVFTFFSVVAICVACIGLYGLSAYISIARTKEIGIRKTLGGTTLQMFFLLTSRFLIAGVIAVLVSIPLCIFFMDAWLSEYAVRTSIGGRVFAISGSLLFLIIVLTVGYHTTRIALTNPVTIMREP